MKELIKTAVSNFSKGTLTENSLELFEVLGYNTSLTISQSEKTYKSFKENYVDNSPNKDRFNELKAFTKNWKSFDFLFQLADNLSGIKGGKVDNQIINSVVFACIELSASTYSRTQLAEITRQVNILFAMPVVLLFKYNDNITLSVIHRRINKKDEQKDVLEKVSLIKDISLTNPHRAQIDILHDFAFPNLANKKNPTNFVELTNAWESVFNTKALNKQFFKKIANWYFLSVAYSKFPYEYLKSDPKHQDKSKEQLQEIANQKATIRFITRMIFVWFLKEKGLVSNDLFDKNKVSKLLKKFNKKNSSDYYNAILQNLFFATLNKAKEHREFALNKSFHENKANHDVNSLYRYETMFQDENPNNIMKLFENIPFLNGGLFDSLDNKENKEIIDGFSRNEKNQAKMPDFLFFEEEELDFDEELRAIYDTKKGHYEVKGLFAIFNEYKFTIEENTPTETDVALDPYLLGEIFENLLAYYNPETGTTARKGSGSFYTPQEIVNYMVDESLKAYLDTKLSFDVRYELPDDLDRNQKVELVKALSEVKILDPACGSGAFPMGVLYKMVDMLKHIDPDNSIWKQIQHDKIIGDKIVELEADKKAIEGLSDKQVKEKAAKAVEDRLNELETIFNNEYNFDDYARKLYIIQNCIYGVDIQDVAIQISKLRFFLSLIVDQKNEDIKPLPNLETKFVIANTLIGIDLPKFTVMGEDDHSQDTTKALKEELKHVREQHFKAVTRKEKLAIKAQDKAIREKIANSLADVANTRNQFEIEEQNKQIEKLKRELVKANDLPETEEIETGTLFETKKELTYPRKNKIAEINRSIKNCENKIASLQTNTQAELIRAQAMKIAQWDIYNQNAQADWFDMDWMFGIQDGFDVVIGNPPYIKEYTDKSVFDGLRNSKYYIGKMDLWYFFTCQGIDILKNNGTLCFIAPNNWTTNAGAIKMRNKIIEDTRIEKLIDFGNYMVFESASIQTMIMIFKKNNENENYNFVLRKIDNPRPIFNDALDLINNKNTSKNLFINPTFSRLNHKNKTFTFNNVSNDIILDKIKEKHNYFINKKNEIAQGIVCPQDFLNKKNQKILDSKFNVGKGIFALRDEELKDLKLNEKELSLIKPYYTTEQLFKWNANPLNTEWVIYTNSKFKNPEKIKPYPNLKKHLDQFQKIITSDNKPYGLHRSREEEFFVGEKIIALRKCANEPKFTYTDFDCYVSATFYVIKTEKINQKYLISLLNSKLIAFWLKNKGKMQGNNYQLDKEPLLEIPIYNHKKQQPLIDLVNQILEDKKQSKDTTSLEHQIDVMVYHLYGLSYEEACVIDETLKKEDFEKYKIN